MTICACKCMGPVPDTPRPFFGAPKTWLHQLLLLWEPEDHGGFRSCVPFASCPSQAKRANRGNGNWFGLKFCCLVEVVAERTSDVWYEIWSMLLILKVALNVLQKWYINQSFHKVLVCRMLHGFTCLWHPMLAKSTFIHIALEDDLVDPVFFSLSCHWTRDEMESSCPATAL